MLFALFGRKFVLKNAPLVPFVDTRNSAEWDVY
jgi:hypothetical protein